MPSSSLKFHSTRFHSLGTPGPGIRHVWFCLHDHGQSVADFAAQLVNLDTPERLLILPEAPGAGQFPQWFRPPYLGPDLALCRAYLDELADHILADCPSGTPFTVLGCGHGAAAACVWLAGNRFAYRRLVLYAAVFPSTVKRHALFSELPPQPIVVVSTTTAIFTPEAEGQSLLHDLRAAGRSAQLRYVDDGPLTLAALGAAGDEGGLLTH